MVIAIILQARIELRSRTTLGVVQNTGRDAKPYFTLTPT